MEDHHGPAEHDRMVCEEGKHENAEQWQKQKVYHLGRGWSEFWFFKILQKFW